MIRRTLLALALVLACTPGFSQVATGIYNYGSFDTLGFDTVDLGSLNVHFAIPVVNKSGRGLAFQYSLVYDGLVWSPSSSSGSGVWAPSSSFGLHGQLGEGFLGSLSYLQRLIKCYGQQGQGGGFTWEPIYSNYVYSDGFGVSHFFPYQYNQCSNVISGKGPSPDGSGLFLLWRIICNFSGWKVHQSPSKYGGNG